MYDAACTPPPAATFQPLMLKVVGEMIGFNSQNKIKIIDGANEVIRQSGMAMPKLWGKVGDPSNRIHNRLRSTAGQLRRRGLLCFPTAGYWSLTAEGIELARSMTDLSSTPTAPTREEEPTVEPVAEEAPQEPLPQPPAVAAAPVPPVTVWTALGDARVALEASKAVCLATLAQVESALLLLRMSEAQSVEISAPAFVEIPAPFMAPSVEIPVYSPPMLMPPSIEVFEPPVSFSIEMDGPDIATPNETSVWFDKHLTPPKGKAESDLMRMMKGAITKRLPVSARADLVEDHVHTYIMRAIRRNSYATVLRDGGCLPYSKVVSYCLNSGRTDARDMGTNPVCREMYGARTERERVNGVRVTDDSDTPHTLEGRQCFDGDGNLVIPDMTDMTVKTGLDFERVWGRVQEIVNSRLTHGEQYIQVLVHRANGLNLQEIAETEGITRNRAATMLSTARRCLREDFRSKELSALLS